MPVIKAENAKKFAMFGISVTGHAAPSGGARETNVWRLRLPPSAPATPHAIDREEIFVGLEGRALAKVGDEEYELGAGDTLIVPPGVSFALTGLEPGGFEAMVVAPVGFQVLLDSGQRFRPPWTE
jgi:mannose-6-phosphate isomerase-like protein (cupin superfamily)